MKIGAQFYTLRDLCQNTDDFAETLKKVADIGYTTVQISGTCTYEPAWLKEQLDKNGLSCVLPHIPRERLASEAALVAKEHDVFDCRYVGLGSYVFDPEDGENSLLDFETVFGGAAKILKDNGKYFMYHNHAHEFAKCGDKVFLRHIAERIPADLMGFTLDTYWVQMGGGDPAWWLEFLKGRVPCIHLKDFAYDRKMAPVGEGNINFDRVFEKAALAGTQYMLVEQDDCYGEDPLDCLKRSYAFLKANGFE